MNLEEKIVKALIKLEPIMVVGLAKGFGLALLDEAGEPRPFELILGDLLDSIHKLSRSGKRKLLSLLREAH